MLSFPHLLQCLVLDKQNQHNSSEGNPSLASSSHHPRLCFWGKVHPPRSQPTEVNPLHSFHGGHWCWGCPGGSKPSPPPRLPLALLPGLHCSTLLCTAHCTTLHTCGLAAPSPGGSEPHSTAVGIRGEAPGDGSGMDGWTAACTDTLQHQTSLASPPPLPTSSPFFLQ